MKTLMNNRWALLLSIAIMLIFVPASAMADTPVADARVSEQADALDAPDGTEAQPVDLVDAPDVSQAGQEEETDAPDARQGKVSVLASDVETADYRFTVATGELLVKTDSGTSASAIGTFWQGATEFDLSDVRKVVVASSVSTIYLGAFANLPNATGIDLSGFSGSIGNAAFAGCSAVTEIDLSGFSGSIGANAFSGCTNLAQSQSGWLTLPPGVTSIGQSAFSGVSVFPPGQQSGGVILTGAVAPSVHPNWATGLQAVYYPHAWGSGFGPITSSPARYDIPVLTAAAVTRTAVGVAEVAIESVWNGSLYRQVDGAMPSSLAMTVLSTNAAFRSLAVGTQVVSFSALTPGAHTLYFAAEQASGLLPYNVSAVVAVPIPAYQAPAGGGSGWDGSVSGQYQSARLSPRSAVFDKNPQGANHRDISATLDLGSYVFSGIQYGNAMLTAGTDYAVSGNAYTFRTAYLSTLPLGDQSIVFVTSGQDPPTLRVTVIDSALAGGDGTGTDGDGDGDGDVDASGTGSGEDYDLDDGSGAGSDGADGSGSGSDGTGNGSGTPDTGDDAPMMPMLLLVCLVAGAFIQLAVMLRRECRAHRLSARP